MRPFEQEAFDSFIIDSGVIGFFDEPVTMASGRKSQWYVNWRTVAEDAFLLDKLADYLLAYVRYLEENGLLKAAPRCFFGVAEGATKLGLIAQFKFAKQSSQFAPGSHVLAMGRAKPKQHGMAKDRYFLGVPQDCIVVEDVTTTGNSLLECISRLQESQVRIVAAVGLTNRMERRDDGTTVSQAIQALGVPYFNMSNAFELLPRYFRSKSPGEHIVRAIEQEFLDHGVEPLDVSDIF